MKRAAALAAMLGVVACAPEKEAADPRPLAEESPPAPAPLDALPIGARAPVSIAGEWRVAGVNRTAIDLPHAMTASIDDDTIRIVSQCVAFVRRYALVDTRLARLPEGDPEPVCDRGRYPEEEAVQAALAAADTAYRLPDGSLVLEGPGGSITLFTQ